MVSLVKNGCGQSGDGTLKLIVSDESIDWINWFFTYFYKNITIFYKLIPTDLQKLKVDQKIFVWAWIKMGLTSLVTGLLNWIYLKNEWWNQLIFLHVGTNSGKLKVDSIICIVKNDHGPLGHEILKSVVS